MTLRSTPLGAGLLACFAFLFLCNSDIKAQNVTKLEYFLDSDPGFGNGTTVTVAPGTDINANFVIDISSAATGFHNLYVRGYIPPYTVVENGNDVTKGGWSLTAVRNLYKESLSTSSGIVPLSPIVAGEFFVDTDPGFGNGTPVPMTSGLDLSNIAFTFDITSLAQGFHNLYVRFKDANGTWGFTAVRNLYKEVISTSNTAPLAPVVQGEYFFDTDPGFGKGTNISFASSTDINNLSFSCDITSVSQGFHNLFIRFRDANGIWSITSNRNFYKEVLTSGGASQLSKVIRAEYYVDVDSGYGKGTNITVTPSLDISNLAFQVDMRPLSVGLHRIFFRAQDSLGVWSLNASDTFRTLTPNSLTIRVDSNLQSPICPGNAIDVSYTVNAQFNDGNIFTALLSDSVGNFTNAIAIGTLQSTTSGVIHATIPKTTPFGSGYRIRVKGSSPDSTSADNGSNIKIGHPPALTSPGTITVNAEPGQCSAVVNFAATSNDPITYSQQPGTRFPIGYTLVTASVSDSCGNNSVQFTVTVIDNQLPLVKTKAATVPLNQNGQATITAADVDNGTTDNCGIASVIVTPSVFTEANLGVNTVTLTATDVNGNQSTGTTTVTVLQKPVISITLNTYNTTCGQQNGAIAAKISGGTAPYTFSWSNGSNTDSISGLSAGNYSLLVTDANSLTASANGSIATSSAVATPIITVSGPQVLCSGQTAVLSTTAVGNYLWSTGDTSQSTQVTSSGTYTLTVTQNGCSASNTRMVSFSQNHPPILGFTGVTSFTNSILSPLSGIPTQLYRFEVRYTDQDGDLPTNNTLKLLLDYEGNGSYTDARDLTFFMAEKDPTDQNVKDGKDYYFITSAIPASATWKTATMATDVNGCSTLFGPFNGPVVQNKVDISIFANDITFSNAKPDTSSQLTIYATIHNNSGTDANNFKVHLINQFQPNVAYPDILVPYLPGNGSSNKVAVSWNITTPSVPAWCPMQVIIDYDNVLDEPNKLDNQAIRPFTNGNFKSPGDIQITAQVNPQTIYPGNGFTVVGKANYRNTAVKLNDSSCAGATVTATIPKINQTVYGFTNANGEYSLQFLYGPASVDSFLVNVHITDYTLDGDSIAIGQVIPLPPCYGPTLVSSINLSAGTIHPNNELPNSNFRYVKVGDSLQGKVIVTNFGNGTVNDTSILKILLPYGAALASPIKIGDLAPAQSDTINLPTMYFNSAGNTYVQSTADYTNIIRECSEDNHTSTQYISVLANLPDITPYNAGTKTDLGKFNQCQPFPGISFTVQNVGGAKTGAFNNKLTVLINGVADTIINMRIGNIDPLKDTTINFNYVYKGSTGAYAFLLDCDSPNAVTELNENNNSTTKALEIVSCYPDLTVYGCGATSVTPVDPLYPGNITISSTIANTGLLAVTGPFDVDFNVGGTHYIYPFTGTLNPGETRVVSVVAAAPQPGSNNLLVTVDPNAVTNEINKNNNSASTSLCWDFNLTNLICDRSRSFISSSQPLNTPVILQTGLFNYGVYRASDVTVKFEVNGPGIVGWQDIGSVHTAADNLCSCPLTLTLGNPFTFVQKGSYSIRITADWDNKYTECDESNNSITVPVVVNDLPDYITKSEYIAPSLLNPDVNEQITIDLSFQNQGATNADSLNVLTRLDNTDYDSSRTQGLPSGTLKTIRMNKTWSSNIRGVHVIRGVIESKNEVAETNKSNNEATRSIVVGKAPNLYFNSFVVNDDYPSFGSFVNIQSVIKNAGVIGCLATYQLYYLDDNKQEVLITQRSIAVDSLGTITISIPWQVMNTRTTLIARISNGSPVEYNTDDNQATVEVGKLIITTSAVAPSCSTAVDGKAFVSINGGKAPFGKVWSNGSTSDSISAGVGLYYVTVSDAEGTVVSDSVQITANQTNCTNITYYRDLDGDGHGDRTVSLTASSQPQGYVIDSTDCNDNDATIYPGAPEICDGKDNNCNGQVDEGCAVTTSPNIYTIAGNGIAAFTGDGGNATNAQFSYPLAVTTDSLGSIYISDRLNNRVRKISASGIITTIAGTGTSGFSGDGGPAINAQINGPGGLAIDKAGNVYITDQGNNRIRKIDTAGIMTTVAGNGNASYNGDNIPANTASLAEPLGIAIDRSGNLFICDQSNNRIRKVDINGIITTVAGTGVFGYSGDNGLASFAQIKYPSGIAIDRAGNVYFTDHNSHTIRKVSSGIITTIAGTGTAGFGGDGGVAINAQLNSPVALVVDSSGSIYIGDRDNNRIRKIDSSGIITTYVGTGTAGFGGDGGPATNAQLNRPYGVALDKKHNLYIADAQNQRIRVIGNATLSTPIVATGLNFDGVDDYVDLGNYFNYQTFTVEMWVKPGATQVQYADILDNNHTDDQSWVLQQNSNNVNQYYFGGSTGVSPTFNLTPNVWQHIAIVSTANTKTIYVNGIAVVNETNTSPIVYNGSENLRLGRWGNGGRNWNGSMDEFRIWNRPLCQAEIQHYMNNELPFTSGNGLIAYYKMNSGYVNANNSANSTLIDETERHTGTLVNFALNGTTSNWTNGKVADTATTFENAATAISVIGNGTLTCVNTSVTLDAGTSGTFLWSTGETTPSISVVNPGVYKVTVTPDGSCRTTDSIIVAKDTIPPGISIFTPSTVFNCESPGPGNAIALWVNGDGTSIVTDSTGAIIERFEDGSRSVGSPGIYTAVVTGDNGCKSTQQITYTSDFAPPTVTITNHSGTTELTCNVSNISVTANGGRSYLWTGGAFPNSADNIFTVPGVYRVSVTGYNGCTAMDSIVVSTMNDTIPPVITCPGPVSINTTPGSCTGTTTLTPPAVSDNCNSVGNALSFDGGYVAVPDVPILNPINEWTLETWVRRTSTGVQESLIEKYNNPGNQYGYLLRLLDDNKAMAGLVFGCCGGYFIEGATTILPNTWYHLAATFNRSTGVMSLYVNGILDAQLTGMVGLPTQPNTASLKLGARGDDAATRLSNGALMDEVRIWNVERTQAQIQASMNNQLNAQPGLVALYHLNQGVAGSNNTGVTTVLDASGLNNNGSFIDFALTGSTSNWVSGKAFGLTLTNNAPVTYPIGRTNVTWTATDGSGNSATCDQVVTVVDNQKPVFPSIPDVTINNAVGQCYANNILSQPLVTDNCGVQSITNNAGATFPIGVTMVTWTATDVDGNVSTAVQKVTVVDWQAPVFPALPDVIINNVPGQCYGNNILAQPNVTDNCGVASISNNATATFTVGVHTVTWTATDIHGNSSTTNQKVTVVDVQAPVITYCPIIPVQCFVANNTYTIPVLTAIDNCGIQSISYAVTGATSRTGTSANASGIFNPGVSTITWTVRDVNGNTASCTTTVRIDKIDVSIPDAFASGINATIGSPNTIYLGYGGTSITLSPVVTSSLGSGSYTYKWTTGSPAGAGFATTASITVAPNTTITYFVSVKDANGCAQVAQVAKQIAVIDIRCGTGKITVCQSKGGNTTTSCITTPKNGLSSGTYLGACTAAPITVSNARDEAPAQEFTVSVAPNPASDAFTIRLKGSDKTSPVIIRVFNSAGQEVDIRRRKTIGDSFTIGEHYRPGIYMVEAVQSNQIRTIKLIKIPE